MKAELWGVTGLRWTINRNLFIHMTNIMFYEVYKPALGN